MFTFKIYRINNNCDEVKKRDFDYAISELKCLLNNTEVKKIVIERTFAYSPYISEEISLKFASNKACLFLKTENGSYRRFNKLPCVDTCRKPSFDSYGRYDSDEADIYAFPPNRDPVLIKHCGNLYDVESFFAGFYALLRGEKRPEIGRIVYKKEKNDD